MAVFLRCTSTGRVGFCFVWFNVQELPKAQPAVVLVLKRLRRWDNGLKSHPTDWEKPGIEPATPGLQDIGLSPTSGGILILLPGSCSKGRTLGCSGCRGGQKNSNMVMWHIKSMGMTSRTECKLKEF